MNLIERYKLNPLLIVGAVCIGLGIIGGIATPTPFNKMIQFSLAIFFYIFVPGYFLLLSVKLDNLERIILSTGVSISFVSVILFQIDFLGGAINKNSTIFAIIISVALGILSVEKDRLIKLIKK